MLNARPCKTCPYRRDVPSGLWAETEYAKLAAYDLPTEEQTSPVFMCHSDPECLCRGWVDCHENRERGTELLSLRIFELRHGPLDYKGPSRVPVFDSGAEAAIHGMRDIEKPGPEARKAIKKLHGRRK
jgi:hypothetical protein